jgi:hypothetical protein
MKPTSGDQVLLALDAQSIGGKIFYIMSTGTTSGWGAQNLIFWDSNLGRNCMQFSPGNVFYLSCGGVLGARQVGTTGPDAAGPGWRYLTISN